MPWLMGIFVIRSYGEVIRRVASSHSFARRSQGALKLFQKFKIFIQTSKFAYFLAVFEKKLNFQLQFAPWSEDDIIREI